MYLATTSVHMNSDTIRLLYVAGISVLVDGVLQYGLLTAVPASHSHLSHLARHI